MWCFVNQTQLKTYQNPQNYSGKHTFTAPCRIDPRNKSPNIWITSGLQRARFQDFPPYSIGTAWPHWRLPLSQRKRLVRSQTKHRLIFSHQIFFMKFTCVIWDLYIDIKSNQSWHDSQRTVPFSVHPVRMTSPTSLLYFARIANTSNTYGQIGTLDLTQFHISRSDVKTNIRFPSHTRTRIFYSHQYII